LKTLAELVAALRRDGIAHDISRSGGAWMLVAPRLGARVLGAGIGEENLLWTARRFPGGRWADGGNAGGARTWIAPEGGPDGFFYPGGGAHWDVPHDLDPGDYRPCAAVQGWASFRNAFTARASDGALFPVAVIRCMRIEAVQGQAAAARIHISQQIENAGSSPIDRRITPWSIAQIPSDVGGTVVIGLRPGFGRESLVPYFGTGGAIVARASGSSLLVKSLGGTRWKLGVPARAAAGAIAFVRPSRLGLGGLWTLVSLRFAVDPQGTYLDKHAYGRGEPPGGDAVQVYSDPGTGSEAFSEIEAHAPARLLAPGSSQEAEVAMTVATGPLEGVNDLLGADGFPGLTPSDLSW
jgi:hypothetical protein